MTVQANYKDIADNYIRALGGADNIDSLVNCATRIRVIVKKRLPQIALLHK